MRRSIPPIAILTSLAAIAPAWPAALDARELIAKLARPADTSVAFTEVRFSPLLDRPSIVSGELGYRGPGKLDRRLTEPYREITSINGESVRVEREGEAPRTFALRRAPELRGLLTAFSALLAGDPTQVDRDFTLEARGDDEHWTLALTPRDARARKHLDRITIAGQDGTPTCLVMHATGGARSFLIFGERSSTPIETTVTPGELASRCRLGDADA